MEFVFHFFILVLTVYTEMPHTKHWSFMDYYVQNVHVQCTYTADVYGHVQCTYTADVYWLLCACTMYIHCRPSVSVDAWLFFLGCCPRFLQGSGEPWEQSFQTNFDCVRRRGLGRHAKRYVKNAQEDILKKCGQCPRRHTKKM